MTWLSGETSLGSAFTHRLKGDENTNLSTWYTSRTSDTAVNMKKFFPREAYMLVKELNHKQVNKYKLMSCDNHQEEK